MSKLEAPTNEGEPVELRLDRIEKTLGTLIAWSILDLGEVNARNLLDILLGDEE